MSDKQHKEVWGVVERADRSYWTRIGVAFINRDGSLTQRMDFVPTDPATSVVIRDPRPKEHGAEPDGQ